MTDDTSGVDFPIDYVPTNPNINGVRSIGAQEFFKLWLALPPAVREPRTQQDLAEQLGVSPITLHKWKTSPGFADSVVYLARDLLKSERLGEILEALADKAVSGNVAAIRLVLETVGVLPGPRFALNATQVNVSGDGVAVKSAKEILLERLARLEMDGKANWQPTIEHVPEPDPQEVEHQQGLSPHLPASPTPLRELDHWSMHEF